MIEAPEAPEVEEKGPSLPPEVNVQSRIPVGRIHEMSVKRRLHRVGRGRSGAYEPSS